MLALEFKGLTYESKRLDPSAGEHKKPKFLAMNPRGKVHVLQDGDFTVYESLAIFAYLERKHTEPALFGTNAQETAAIWQRVLELDNYTAASVMRIVGPILFGSEGPQLAELEEPVAEIQRELKSLDDHLSASSYLHR